MILDRGTTTTVVLRTLDRPAALPARTPGRARVRQSRPAGRVARAIGALSVLFVALFSMVFAGGLPGTTSPAQAGLFDDVLCMYGDPAEYTPSPDMWPGLMGGLGSVSRDFTQISGTVSGGPLVVGATGGVDSIVGTLEKYTKIYGPEARVTAYEWYGTAGQTWDMNWYPDITSQCQPFTAMAGNTVSNLALFISQGVAEIGLTIFGWAYSVDAITPFLGSIDAVVFALRDALFLQYLTPIIMLGALWMAWVGLVKKRSSEAIQGVTWMVLASAATLVFLNQPAAITKAINGVIVTVSEQVTNSVLGAVSGVPKTDLCSAGGEGRQWRIAQCQIWQAYVFSPWNAGMFGPISGSGIEVGDEAVSVSIPGKAPSNALPLVYLDSQTFNHDQTLKALSNVFDAENFGPDSPEIEKKKAQWTAVYDSIKEGEAYGARPYFTGEDWTGRVGIALVNLVAMAVGAIPILFLAFTLVIMQLGMVLLMLAAPLFLTLGIHPGFGRRIATSWAEMLISLGLKRLGTSLLLTLLLAVFMAVQRSTDSWLAKAMLVGAVSIAVLVFRKRLLDMLKINLGGGQGIDGQALGQKAKQYSRVGGGAVAQGAGRAMATEGGGRLGAFLAGGAAGAMMGSRGGPAAGILMAGRRGKAQGRRGSSGAGGAAPDANDPVVRAEALEREAREQRREEAADRDANRQGVSPEEQVAGWASRYQRTGREAPASINDEVTRQLIEQGVPVRPRVGDLLQQRADNERTRDARVAEAAASADRASETRTETVVNVLNEQTRETTRVTDTLSSASGDSDNRPDYATQMYRRIIAKQQAEAQRLEEEKAKQGEDKHTRDVGPTRPPKIADE